MKHLKEYNDEELKDLVSSLKSVGLSDWSGFYITYKLKGDSAAAMAIAVVGESWKIIAESLLDDFGIDDAEEAEIDLEDLTSIELILDAIDNFWGTGMGNDWDSFEYKFWEMTPKKLENSLESADLLDTGDCLEMGRRYFSDFDSVLLKPRY